MFLIIKCYKNVKDYYYDFIVSKSRGVANDLILCSLIMQKTLREAIFFWLFNGQVVPPREEIAHLTHTSHHAGLSCLLSCLWSACPPKRKRKLHDRGSSICIVLNVAHSRYFCGTSEQMNGVLLQIAKCQVTETAQGHRDFNPKGTLHGITPPKALPVNQCWLPWTAKTRVGVEASMNNWRPALYFWNKDTEEQMRLKSLQRTSFIRPGRLPDCAWFPLPSSWGYSVQVLSFQSYLNEGSQR